MSQAQTKMLTEIRSAGFVTVTLKVRKTADALERAGLIKIVAHELYSGAMCKAVLA
jgi:hypothetical protein